MMKMGSYLGGLVRVSHALPFCVKIFKILSPLAALHSNQMAAMLCGWKEIKNQPSSFLQQQQIPISTSKKGFLTIFVLVVGAPADHLPDVLGLFVDGCGSEESTLGRLLSHQDSDGAGFRQLTIKFI